MRALPLYILIGFLAQMIDGSLGMAYGVSCRTFLRSAAGLPAPIASAVIHIAEIPSSLASGIAHTRIGNLDRALFRRLLIPGMIGGILGAWFLSGFGSRLEPVIDVYLILMGVLILGKLRPGRSRSRGSEMTPGNQDASAPISGSIANRAIGPLGFAGGFLDAAGGGGWGPVVTSTMVAAGGDVKKTIGTVNTAEFLVTIAETTAFAVLIRDFRAHWPIILGLITGGVIAAPIAARICRKLPTRPLMAAVGCTVIGLNIYNLIRWFTPV